MFSEANLAQKAMSSTIELHDDDPTVVEKFLAAVYTEGCRDPQTEQVTGYEYWNKTVSNLGKDILENCQVDSMADKYDAPAVRELALNNLRCPFKDHNADAVFNTTDSLEGVRVAFEHRPSRLWKLVLLAMPNFQPDYLLDPWKGFLEECPEAADNLISSYKIMPEKLEVCKYCNVYYESNPDMLNLCTKCDYSDGMVIMRMVSA